MASKKLKIGILALQGDVREHIWATTTAAKKLGIGLLLVEVRALKDLENVSGLIIPGGESTVLWKLLEREKMFEECAKVPNVFGTCAGLILMAKKIEDGAEGQKSFGLIDIDVKRNAYGPQTESFEDGIESKLGNCAVAFIRAPKISRVGKEVAKIATYKREVIGVEQQTGSGKSNRYFLGLTFHPEITGVNRFHELFLKKVSLKK